ncbi:C40 family peptidase [Clostridium sp. BL-8]|uniref:C40 family peptidase n=1 Tax=Clostridium sp. BL-8 TaxID=349938 RepID=UPI00098C89C4|nr:C40 family peptidase [Clostridium sp. BL-8]OOM81175.1 putative endopeptidase p60 precursor [Clostridium sp. BL-8]
MKSRILAITLATVIVIGSSIPAFATPDNQQLSDSRQKYADIQSKITDIENKIYDLDTQIEPLQVTVDKNKKEITSINNTIDNTTKDIEQCKKDINTLDLALGQRVKAMYTSGDLEFSYLNFILESESTSDFFSRAEAVSKILGKDKAAIEDVTSKKQELNDKIQSLEDKKAEIDKLNKEIQTNLDELDGKKKEEETLSAQAKDEKSKFDAQYLSQLERDTVKTQFDVIDNSNSSASDLQSAIDQLRNIRDNQIKSEIVTSEINDKIEKAKAAVSTKKAAEVKSATSTASRGGRVAVPSAGNAQAILNEAYAQLGKPYVWGATGANSFDCSGFTQYVYENAAGIDISRTTYSQINQGQAVSQDQLQPGDLVFTHPGHVGIYVGNGQMINAPQTGDVVKVAPVYSFYAARRILN